MKKEYKDFNITAVKNGYNVEYKEMGIKETLPTEEEAREFIDDYYFENRLDRHFKYNFVDNYDDEIIIHDNGKEVKLNYELNLSQDFNDDECMRIKHRGKYYYFGC